MEFPQPGVERIQVDTAVYDVQLFFGQSEMALNFLFDHVRIAYHRLELRAGEEFFFRREHVAVVRIEGDAESAQRAEHASALGQPLAVNAIAGAVYVAAGDTLVRLNQVEILVCQRAADATGEAPVAPQAAEVKGVADQG